MLPLEADNFRTVRAAILSIVYDNQRRQASRLSLVQVASALERMFFDISLNDLTTVMQDMAERGYVSFKQERNKWTHETRIGEIQILPKGRNLVERIENDPAVQFE